MINLSDIDAFTEHEKVGIVWILTLIFNWRYLPKSTLFIHWKLGARSETHYFTVIDKINPISSPKFWAGTNDALLSPMESFQSEMEISLSIVDYQHNSVSPSPLLSSLTIFTGSFT